MSNRLLAVAALCFAILALAAGGLQVWAYVVGGAARHLVVGIFAVMVGCSVLAAVIGGRVRRGGR